MICIKSHEKQIIGLVDNLYMTYEGNQLTSVRDNASRMAYSGATDFDGVTGQEYPLTYNGAGSLESDAGRRIARIDYDMMNNPIRIQFTNGNVTKYIYSAAGEKLRVIYQTAVPNITVAIGSVRELAPSEILYTDSTDYLLGGALTLRNGRIDKYQFEEGYCQAESLNATQDNFTFMYYDKDHLGNVRQVTKATGSTGTVMQTLNYYPFGAQFCDGSVATSDVQPYRYNGKELDKMHGLNTYDYGARQYNPVTARWDRMDPLAEKDPATSPFVYCKDIPVMLIDPDGMIWEDPKESEELIIKINKRISQLEKENQKIQIKIDSGKYSENKLKKIEENKNENNEMISNLKKSINDINRLGEDVNTYAFRHIDGGKHHVVKEEGIVYIETFSDALSIHEITHVRQSLENGGLKFSPEGNLYNIGNGLSHSSGYRIISESEVESYQMQYSYDRSFPRVVSRLKDINVHSVGNIRDEDGQLLYPAIYKYSNYIKKRKTSH